MNAHIKWNDVTVSVKATELGEGKQLLASLSFSIKKGEWVQLYGRNGSGKSTLLKMLAGIKRYESTGEKLIFGEAQTETAALTPMVLQQPSVGIIGSSCWEDVVLMLEQHQASPEGVLERAEQVISMLGLEPYQHKPIEELSGGQQQLVAIAGAIAVSEELLLLDEVISMLDSEAASLVYAHIRKLNKQGVTVIWATQNMEECDRGDRVLALDKGKLVFDGEMVNWFLQNELDEQGNRISRCEQLGYEAPYVVRLARELEENNIVLRQLPLTMKELEAELANNG